MNALIEKAKAVIENHDREIAARRQQITQLQQQIQEFEISKADWIRCLDTANDQPNLDPGK